MNNTLSEILKASLEEKVCSYITSNFKEVKSLSLFELGIDSLDYMKLLVNIEEKLDMEIDELGSFNTLEDIERMIIHD